MAIFLKIGWKYADFWNIFFHWNSHKILRNEYFWLKFDIFAIEGMPDEVNEKKIIHVIFIYFWWPTKLRLCKKSAFFGHLGALKTPKEQFFLNCYFMIFCAPSKDKKKLQKFWGWCKNWNHNAGFNENAQKVSKKVKIPTLRSMCDP